MNVFERLPRQLQITCVKLLKPEGVPSCANSRANQTKRSSVAAVTGWQRNASGPWFAFVV